MSATDTRQADERLESGFFANQVRANFRNLCRMVGFDQARATVAEIISSEAERTSGKEPA